MSDLDHIKENIESSFKGCAGHIRYARKWIDMFLKERLKYKITGS